MPEAPTLAQLGAATLVRDWRLEVDGAGIDFGKAGAATATSGSPTLTLASHGLVVGQEVVVTNATTPPTGFTAGTTYYVIAAGFTTGAFQLSATPGGAAISPTAAGTLSYTRGAFWLPVKGRTEFKPTIDSTLQDDSDMDSEGWKSQTRTAAAWMAEFKVVRKAQLSVGGYDPGQEVLRLAGDQVGPYNSVLCRWYKLGAVRTEAYRGNAAVSWAPDGGAMDALDTASVTLTGQGRRVSIPHPYTLP